MVSTVCNIDAVFHVPSHVACTVPHPHPTPLWLRHTLINQRLMIQFKTIPSIPRLVIYGRVPSFMKTKARIMILRPHINRFPVSCRYRNTFYGSSRIAKMNVYVNYLNCKPSLQLQHVQPGTRALISILKTLILIRGKMTLVQTF